MKRNRNYQPEGTIFPLLGVDYLIPSTQLNPRHAVDLKNIEITRGLARKRRGYRQLGSTLDANPIMMLQEFETSAGVKYLVASTTLRQYRYDSSGPSWVDITPRNSSRAINAVDQGTKTFTHNTNDITSEYPTGAAFHISGSTGNDGAYTVVSSAYSTNTTIVVSETIPDATADGTMASDIDLTGDETNQFDWVIGQDESSKRIILTNGVDKPREWTGTNQFTVTAWTVAGDSIDTVGSVETFYDHLVLGNVKVNGNENKQKIYWSDTTDFDDFDNGNAGDNLFADARGDLFKLEVFGDRMVVYFDDSIATVLFIQGIEVFGFDNLVQDTRYLAKRGVINIGPFQLFESQENIYLFEGTRQFGTVGDRIQERYRQEVSYPLKERGHAFHDKPKKKIYFAIPFSDTETICYVAEYLILSPNDYVWSKYVFADRATAFGFFTRESTITWDNQEYNAKLWNELSLNWNEGSAREGFPVLVMGDSTGNVYALDDVFNTDDGNSIDAYWISKDFTLPDVSLNENPRWIEAELELKGTSVNVEYSPDQGNSWYYMAQEADGSNSQGVTLSSNWVKYKFFFDVRSPTLRIRLSDSGSDAFEFRWLKVWHTTMGAVE